MPQSGATRLDGSPPPAESVAVARPVVLPPAGRSRVAVVIAVVAVIAGIGYRLHQFGQFGFWNDEAWVALSTRVEGLSQFLLVVACSPALWTLLLRPFAELPHPEVSLRLVPLAFSLATLWLAWHLGRRIAGHALGGALAVALVALDPTSIQYAKQLKQYSAEVVVLLASLALAVDVACDGRHLRALAAVLLIGLGVSNSQLLATPAVLAAVLLVALLERNRWLLPRLIVTGMLVGFADLLFYAFVVRPWNSPALHEFWIGHYLSGGDLVAAVGNARVALATVLRPGLGPHALWIAGAAVVTMLFAREGRVVAAALVLLVAELTVLARFELVPVGVPRISLFYSTAILVLVGAAVARVVVAIGGRPRWRPAAAIALAAASWLIVLERPWATMGDVEFPEDVGPFIRRVEKNRRPDDRILLYNNTVYVYAYYMKRTPKLIPFPTLSVGFFPLLDDPAVTVVTPQSFPHLVDRATAGGRRVWFIGSRFWGDHRVELETMFSARWPPDLTRRRAHALLMRARL